MAWRFRHLPTTPMGILSQTTCQAMVTTRLGHGSANKNWQSSTSHALGTTHQGALQPEGEQHPRQGSLLSQDLTAWASGSCVPYLAAPFTEQ